jgi:hypothetical protein
MSSGWANIRNRNFGEYSKQYFSTIYGQILMIFVAFESQSQYACDDIFGFVFYVENSIWALLLLFRITME